MECEQVRPALMEYLLEEIAAEQATDIERHLGQCSACSQEAGKFRQVLALVRQAQHMEEIPQRIRLASEPSGRRRAFWLQPVRLALAASALACLAIALLALSRATISIGGGGMRIAFGPLPAAPAVSVAAHASVQNAAAQRPAQGITRDEVVQLVSQAVADSEARQQDHEKRILKDVSQQNEQQRMRDWNEVSESLRPLEAAQVTIWKQQVQSDQYVSELMQQAGMQLPEK